MKRLLVYFTLVLTLSYFSVIHSLHASDKNVSSFTLSNGMDVIVITNRKVPAVSHMVWYKVGAMDEPPGKSGIAHYLEHLMFKDTDKLKAGEFSKIVAQHGGNDNAFTSQDFTAYFQNIAVEHLELVMSLEAGRMMSLSLTKDSILKERDVVLEERSQRIDNHPGSILTERMRKMLYQDHPYGISTIGWKEEISELAFADVLEFYQQYYRPDNATLIVSGDIDAETLRPLAEKYYGKIQAPNSKLIARGGYLKFFPTNKAPLETELKDERVLQKEWVRYYAAPSVVSGDLKETFPLVVLSQILGGSATSRLYQSLVIENAVATSAQTYYNEMSYGPTLFGIFATPADNNDFSDVENLLKIEIDKILENGVSDEELVIAKNLLIAESTYARDGVRNMAYIYGQVAALGLSPDYVDEWDDIISKVTASDVLAAARNLFNTKTYITGKLMGNDK